MAGRSIPAHRIVMVGDNLSADVAGGKTMGYRTALLLTGVTSETALGMAPGDQLPDVVCDGL
jgi:ribonucleotide monophosphatase NagD (HAD superfamily)